MTYVRILRNLSKWMRNIWQMHMPVEEMKRETTATKSCKEWFMIRPTLEFCESEDSLR